MGRRITILGMGMSARERRWDIEKYCEGTEIWGLNDGYGMYEHLKGKWSRYFEVHKWDYLKEWSKDNPDYFRSLNSLGCPIVTTQHLPIIENQMPHETLEYCKHFKTNYFLGSPSLMLMMALYEHDHGQPIEEIRSWGIDTQDDSHKQQRHSWAWWLRTAHDKGIKFSGTASDFMAEKDNDEGLQGYREFIGQQMVEDTEFCRQNNIEENKTGE